MQSPNKKAGTPHQKDVKKLVLIGMMISIALVLSYFERFVPLNISAPGIKLGLANIITLIGLFMFTFYEVFLIVIIRVIMTALFAGSVMSFFYSLTGGLLSLFAMYWMMRNMKNRVTLLGISIFGAAWHNVGQVLVLGIITNSLTIALNLLPYLLVAGAISGSLIGLVGLYFYNHMRQLPVKIFR